MFWTLSARLFLLIAAISLAGLGGLAWFEVADHTAHLEEEVVKSALRLSDTLRRSTRSGMLRNRKEDVYEIIQTVGMQPGIQRIRIYNKEGQIRHSTLAGEQGESVDTRAEACTRCHDGEHPLENPEGRELTRIFRDSEGHRVVGLITPIYHESKCTGGACHTDVKSQKVLGVLDVQLSLKEVDQSLMERNRGFLLLTYGLMLVIASTCGLFVWRFVHIPVRTLIKGTEELARGNLDHRMSIRSRTEIGRLAQAFDRMAQELDGANEQLTDWTHTLVDRVEEKTRSLRRAQHTLIESEKMASLGSLSAAVAHEINNPLSGVLTYTRLIRKILGSNSPPNRVPELNEYLDTIADEVERCGKIVRNLLEFSRQSNMEVGEADLNEILERALFLIGHRLDLQGIGLTKALSPDLPRMTCDADQIQQALLALLINAIQAMPDGGELKVLTEKASGSNDLRVEIGDTGCGIPQDALAHVFEPFFTTKQDQAGVGLGLSVVYGIIQRHHGRIDVDSEEGRGTRFVLVLPPDAPISEETAELELPMREEEEESAV